MTSKTIQWGRGGGGFHLLSSLSCKRSYETENYKLVSRGGFALVSRSGFTQLKLLLFKSQKIFSAIIYSSGGREEGLSTLGSSMRVRPYVFKFPLVRFFVDISHFDVYFFHVLYFVLLFYVLFCC